MKLTMIKEALEQFKVYLTSDKAYEMLFLYEGIKNFQLNWNLSEENLSKMYLKATNNTTSNRLWRENNGHPREVMSGFFHYDSVYSIFLFKDLFNDEMAIESRLDRFIFHCEQLYEELRPYYDNSPHDSHYHSKKTASIYLAFLKPHQYPVYDWEKFTTFLPFLQVADPPTYEDPARYYKVSKILFNFIAKDKEIGTLHKKRLEPEKHFINKTQTLVYELYSVFNP